MGRTFSRRQRIEEAAARGIEQNEHTMLYSNDRQRIELLLLPAMLQVLVTMIRNNLGENEAILDDIAALLTQAMTEPLAGLPPGRANSLVRRAMRATGDVMTSLSGRLILSQYLAIADLIMDLTERDYLVVGPDSPFALAWDRLAEIMRVAMDNLAVDGPVAEAVVELRRRLQANGYFQGA
ncbi:MAG: hypothetical protein H7840_17985 [Alphaproteobacteria bacterium]